MAAPTVVPNAEATGLLLRSGTLTREPLADALKRLVLEPAYREAAGRLRDEFARWNALAAFTAFIEEATA